MIRGVSEETGELSDELVSMMPTMEKQFAAVGLTLRKDKDTFKSTYEIMKDLASVWEDLTDMQRADLLESVAGKRQGQIVAALIGNFENVEKALETAQNSMGSAQREWERFTDSIEYKSNRLGQSMVLFWQNLIDRESIKTFIDGLNGIVKVMDTLVNNPLTGFIIKTLALAAILPGIERAFFGLTNIMWGLNKAQLASYASGLKFLYVQNGLILTTKLLTKALWASPLFKAMVLITGLTLIINAFTAITKAKKELRREVEELTEAYKQNVSTINDNIKTVQGLSEEYRKLSKSSNLTTEEQKRLFEIQNQLANIAPHLVTGYDDQGNSIISLKGNTDELIDSLKEQLKLEKMIRVGQSGKIIEDTTNQMKELNAQIDESNRKLQSLAQGGSLSPTPDVSPWLMRGLPITEVVFSVKALKHLKDYELGIENLDVLIKGTSVSMRALQKINLTNGKIYEFLADKLEFFNLKKLEHNVLSMQELANIQVYNTLLTQQEMVRKDLAKDYFDIANSSKELDSGTKDLVKSFIDLSNSFNEADMSASDVYAEVEKLIITLQDSGFKKGIDTIEGLNKKFKDGKLPADKYNEAIEKILFRLSRLAGVSLERLRREFKLTGDTAEEMAEDVVESLRSMEEVIEEIESLTGLYDTINQEIEEYGDISAKTMLDIIQNHDELIVPMLIKEIDLREALTKRSIELEEELLDVYKHSVQQKIIANKELFDYTLGTNQNLVNALSKLYGTNLSSWQQMTQLQMEATRAAATYIGKAAAAMLNFGQQAKVLTEMAGKIHSAVGRSSLPDHLKIAMMEDVRYFLDMADALSAAEIDFDEFSLPSMPSIGGSVTPVGKTPTGTGDKDSNIKDQSESLREYNLQLDEFYNKIRKIAKVEADIEKLRIERSAMDAPEEITKSIIEENELLEEKKRLLQGLGAIQKNSLDTYAKQAKQYSEYIKITEDGQMIFQDAYKDGLKLTSQSSQIDHDRAESIEKLMEANNGLYDSYRQTNASIEETNNLYSENIELMESLIPQLDRYHRQLAQRLILQNKISKEQKERELMENPRHIMDSLRREIELHKEDLAVLKDKREEKQKDYNQESSNIRRFEREHGKVFEITADGIHIIESRFKNLGLNAQEEAIQIRDRFNEIALALQQLGLDILDVELIMKNLGKTIEQIQTDLEDKLIEAIKRGLARTRDLKIANAEAEAKALREQYDKEIKALEERHKQKMDMLDDELSRYQDIIAARLRLLDQEQSEENFQRQLIKLQQERANLERQINILSLDPLENKQRISDLRKQMGEKDEEIELAISNRTTDMRREHYNDLLKNMQENSEERKMLLEEEHEAEIQALDQEERFKTMIELEESIVAIRKKYNDELADNRMWDELRLQGLEAIYQKLLEINAALEEQYQITDFDKIDIPEGDVQADLDNTEDILDEAVEHDPQLNPGDRDMTSTADSWKVLEAYLKQKHGRDDDKPLNVQDAIKVLRTIVGIKTNALEEGESELFNITGGDSGLNVMDAIAILRRIVGLDNAGDIKSITLEEFDKIMEMIDGMTPEQKSIIESQLFNIPTMHSGGIVGSSNTTSNNKSMQYINKLFNTKSDEKIVKAQVGELMIPKENIFKNFIPNMSSVINSASRQLVGATNSSNINMGGIVVNLMKGTKQEANLAGKYVFDSLVNNLNKKGLKL